MDESYQLTTPENVPISYELAGVGSRFVAALLDGLIIAATQVGLFVLAGIAALILSGRQPGLAALAFALALLAAVAVFLVYDLLFEIVWNGQTPGKRATGIRVVRDDGSPITAIAAVVRNVVRLVDFLPVYYITGTAAMLIDHKTRRLGDLAAGTIVVKERGDVAADRLTLAAVVPRQDEPVVADAAPEDVSRLSYDDYYLIKEYLLRRDQLAPAPAHELAVRIAGLIAAKLGSEMAHSSAEDYLVRIGSALERAGRR